MKVASDGIMSLPESEPPILLVEDNLLNQRVALILLQRMGLTASVANNGKEAVALAIATDWALILMDCHMPEMDGFEATVAIRKHEQSTGKYTPIIAVTALAMAGDRERCIAAGMDDYIAKPIDKDILQAKIRHWLRSDVVYRSQKKTRRSQLRSQANIMLLESDPINIPELEEFYGAELEQNLRLFMTDTEEKIKRIGALMTDKEVRPIAGLAHEIKASCASIGAKSLARLCLYLENAVGQQDWIEAEETLHSLQRSFDLLQAYINSKLTPEEVEAAI